MRPVDQDCFEPGKGNCFSACLASLLELPLSAVPNFNLEEDWEKARREWLASQGLRLISFYFKTESRLREMGMEAPEFGILTGPSPRSTHERRVNHAVVARTSFWGVEIAHDPHPERKGLSKGHRRLYFVIPGGN